MYQLTELANDWRAELLTIVGMVSQRAPALPARHPIIVIPLFLPRAAVLGVLVYLLLTYGNAVPQVVRHVIYFFALYSFVGFIMDGPAALLVGALGLELVPTFDQPWMVG